MVIIITQLLMLIEHLLCAKHFVTHDNNLILSFELGAVILKIRKLRQGEVNGLSKVT